LENICVKAAKSMDGRIVGVDLMESEEEG